MIKARNLTRKYGHFVAVNDISFDVPKGQIVGLLGHNGAGKTTTLKMLTGFLEPSSGSISIEGLDIVEHRLSLQEKIGYLPESSPLYQEMSAAEYLDYCAELRNIPEAKRANAIRDAIEATDLSSKATSLISTLSKGYQQRVGVAQAILHKPDLLILDEPTNGLDPTQILAMRSLIKELSKSSTVIISTHIMQEVEAICDRVLIVLDGRLVVDSLLADLKKGNTIKLEVREELDEVKSLLSGISGIEEITLDNSQSSLNKIAIKTDITKQEIVPEIAQKIINKGWKLYQLNTEQKDLQSVFTEVNRSSHKGEAHVQ